LYYDVTSPVYRETVIVERPVYTEVEERQAGEPTSTYVQAPRPTADDTGYAGTTLGPQAETGMAPSENEHLFLMMFEGTKAFQEGDYDAAARLFLDVSMQDPANIDGTLAYAVARFATGDYAISAIAIRRGIRRFCEVVDSGFDIRDRYDDQEDFDRHVRMLEQFLDDRPENVDATIVAGFVLHFAGQREQAVQVFNEVKRLSPSDADVADCFLNAKPPEVIEQPESGAQEDATPSDTTGPEPNPTP
jgi:tetratricopeptide (TPR) repeat protein